MLNLSGIKAFFLALAVVLLCMCACKAKKKIGSIKKKVNSQVVIIMPFDTKEFKSDSFYFRARGAGNHIKLATAKKAGLQNANAEMDTLLQKFMSDVLIKYVKKADVKDEQDFIKQALLVVSKLKKDEWNNENLLAEKIVKEADNTYTYWCVIEIIKVTLVDSFEKILIASGIVFDKDMFETLLKDKNKITKAEK